MMVENREGVCESMLDVRLERLTEARIEAE